MKDILKEICENKLLEIEKKKQTKTLEEIIAETESLSEIRGFIKALKNSQESDKCPIIAEVKKKSPSKGIIREDFDPVEIAKSYEKAGATCISVLTDEKYFAGSDKYLEHIREEVSIPLLRKDFILDEYQIYESRLLGADCILLIIAALNIDKAIKLESLAHSLSMDVLIEIHDEGELEDALKMKSKLIGVNNRNLKNMDVSLNNSLSMIENIPAEYFKICESGIKNQNDMKAMLKAGFDGFLIGETFMRSDNIENSVKSFVEDRIE
jgi:indole-3-glycerol phosphate synthase